MEKKLTRAEEYKRTQQKIIQIANQLFMKNGYNAVSTRKIAKECGLTQPALYHHFRDKESIYLAVIYHITADIRQEFSRLKDHNLYDPPKVILNNMLLILIEKHPTNIMMMIQDILNELDKKNQYILYELWQQTYLSPFKELFAEWAKHGLIREHLDIDAAARFCLSSIVPLTSKHSVTAKESSLSDRLNATIDFLLYGLLK
ncbi:TetR/AcrR family transcriptional regulator [Sporolactobacillus laevolacticus]|uniref:TetR family transcriptional regulator n=1 Tax=Sporolactobacillus laevolacticus DSM 442 TaxID=1395513 RepID=V6IUN6_9BACL|nr:TetR/AcrR family transcriptional regulator [Sporolactobacillus laevolacticus]EST10752.1 TetR family transcriptional regulator [Sporolactobacillus laevolacticus DSM 442]